MTEPTNNSSLDEAKRSPVPPGQITEGLRPPSSLSGGSDNDGSERPVREKLKKASIAGLSSHAKGKEDNVKADGGSAESSAGEEEKGIEDAMLTDTTSPVRGRPTRKRSFDDLQTDSMASIDVKVHDDAVRPGGHHKRMRSKDMSSSKTVAVNGKAERDQVEPLAETEDDAEAHRSPGGAGIMVETPSIDDAAAVSGNQSPKKKRSRDQFDRDHSPGGDSLEKESNATLPERQPLEIEGEPNRTSTNGDKGEPDKKRHRDASQEAREAADAELTTTKVDKPSGFANISAVSPFGALASSKSPTPATRSPEPDATKEKQQTSSSAFASSGLSAFASSKSPFGSLGTSSGPASGSGFGSFGPKPTIGFGSSSGFGGASPFAMKAPSGFGSLGGSGFGSAQRSGFGGSKTGISSFAPSGGPSGIVGSGFSSKPLGQPEEDDENDDENNDAASSKADDEANEKDSRFYEQQTETGEEAEETMFSCRAKLFHFEKEWKERGVGTLKLNVHYTVKEDPDEVPEQKARLIMRTDGVHRVVLNTPVFKGMRFGTPDGQEPTGKTLNLTGMEDGKPALFLLKIGKEDVVKELFLRISSIHDGL